MRVVESRFFLEVLTKYMDCIVLCESWVVDGFRRRSDSKCALYCTWLDVGESRVFDRGLTTGESSSEEMQMQIN